MNFDNFITIIHLNIDYLTMVTLIILIMFFFKINLSKVGNRKNTIEILWNTYSLTIIFHSISKHLIIHRESLNHVC